MAVKIKIPCYEYIRHFFIFRYPDGIYLSKYDEQSYWVRSLLSKPPFVSEYRQEKFTSHVFIYGPEKWFDNRLTYISNRNIRRFNDKFHQLFCDDLCAFINMHRGEKKIMEAAFLYMQKIGMTEDKYQIEWLLKLYQRHRPHFLEKNEENLHLEDNEKIHVSFA